MKSNLLQKTFLTCSFFLCINSYAQDENPCTGQDALLSLLNRPTISDSACIVPYRNEILESGFQYVKLQGNGYGQNAPEAALRLGLPAYTEFVILPPNYIHQSIMPHAGFAPTTLGVKHAFSFDKNYIFSAESLVTLPSGSNTFGSHGMGVTVNGIVNYNITPALGVDFFLGVASLTTSNAAGGQRFTTINPDMVVTWIHEKIEFFGEIYGQTKTSPSDSSGFLADAGLIYLITQHWTVDLEVGQRLYGNLGFNHYVGAGMGMQFG